MNPLINELSDTAQSLPVPTMTPLSPTCSCHHTTPPIQNPQLARLTQLTLTILRTGLVTAASELYDLTSDFEFQLSRIFTYKDRFEGAFTGLEELETYVTTLIYGCGADDMDAGALLEPLNQSLEEGWADLLVL